MSSDQLSKSDRDALIRIAKGRARQAKTEADKRQKVLLAEVEDLITAEFEARNELWAEAMKIAEEAVQRANEQIEASCADLGIPPRYAPSVSLGWNARSREFNDPGRRAELRKLAQARLTALTAEAKTAIDARVLDIEEKLITGGLESAEAREIVELMPSPEDLMPSLSLDQIGVKHWQPPTDAAAALLTPSTTVDRKRKKILRAIEANPDASNSRIAEIAGVDRKTVAKYRTGAAESLTAGDQVVSESAEVLSDGDGSGSP